MAILIKGMEMPTGCISCDFCNPFVEEPYCRRLMKRVPKVTRLDNCPLIEVPEPHGRLIDEKDIVPKDGYIIADGMACIPVKDIDNAPTVIPASEEEADEAQRDYERAVEDQRYCEMYEPTYDPETGAM